MPVWLIIVMAYLLGSIPTAYIAGRIVAGKDIRRMGDENTGAANVYRELGPKAGVLVGAFDAAKGALAVIIAQSGHASQNVIMVAGATAVIGHNWPVFLSFRGGRGVSTTLGVLYFLLTLPMLVLTLPTLLILIIKRNVTPAMAFLFIVLPLVGWWLGVSRALIAYGVALPVLVGITTFFRTKLRAVREA